jgi:hypothetical protein
LVPGSNELRKKIYGGDVWEKDAGTKKFDDAKKKWDDIKSDWVDISKTKTPM